MQLGDNGTAYGWVSIALHWIGAAAVIAMWLLGQRIDWQETREAAREATGLHVSVGVIVWAFLFARVAWRLTQPLAQRPKQHWTLNLLSFIVQYGLISVIAVMIITGPLIILMLGRPLSPFGWFEIPSPFASNHDLHELFETIHGAAANLILPLVALHVLGGLKHLIFDRDGVFQRMLGIRQQEPSPWTGEGRVGSSDPR